MIDTEIVGRNSR